MSNITFSHKGDFSKTMKYFQNLQKAVCGENIFDKYGKRGVAALESATPRDSGLAANSWYYEIEQTATSTRIVFCNNDIENGFPVAIMLQYGHGTGTGGWVEGRDYINPAIQPVFDEIANAAWREVTKL